MNGRGRRRTRSAMIVDIKRAGCNRTKEPTWEKREVVNVHYVRNIFW